MITDKQEAKLAYNRAYNQANRDKLNAYRRKHYAKNKHLYRNQMYKMRYGITLEEYNAMLKLQGDVCAICNKTDGTRELAVDHNHTTGAVRGLLCKACNIMVAQIESANHILDNAKEYLGKWDR